jgi:hypothetical protein
MQTLFSRPPYVDDRYHITWNPVTGLLDLNDSIRGYTCGRFNDESAALEACQAANHRSLSGLLPLPVADELHPAEAALHDTAADEQLAIIRHAGRNGPHRTSDIELFAQHQWLLARVDLLTETLTHLWEQCA